MKQSEAMSLYDFHTLLCIDHLPVYTVSFDYAKVMRKQTNSVEKWILRTSSFDKQSGLCQQETLREYTSFLDLNDDYIELRNKYLRDLPPVIARKYINE